MWWFFSGNILKFCGCVCRSNNITFLCRTTIIRSCNQIIRYFFTLRKTCFREITHQIHYYELMVCFSFIYFCVNLLCSSLLWFQRLVYLKFSKILKSFTHLYRSFNLKLQKNMMSCFIKKKSIVDIASKYSINFNRIMTKKNRIFKLSTY